MNQSEIVHVVIIPPAKIETDLIHQAASAIGKDPYGTRLLLSGKIPRVVAHYDNTQAAEAVAQRLRSLGLLVMVCDNSELRKPYRGYRANTMSFENQAIVFRNKGGEIKKMAATDLFLILKGKIQTEMETESTTNARELNLGATILTGGIPIFRKAQTKTKDKSIRTECFARFYGLPTPEPSVEILQYDFDYSFLGPEISLSSGVNFNNLIARISGAFPKAIVDERLMQSFTAGTLLATPRESVDINCTLIYLQYRTFGVKSL